MKYATVLFQDMTYSFIFQQAVSGMDCIKIVNLIGPKTALKNPPINFFLDLYLKKEMLGQRWH